MLYSFSDIEHLWHNDNDVLQQMNEFIMSQHQWELRSGESNFNLVAYPLHILWAPCLTQIVSGINDD